MASIVQMIPLSKLVASPRNVRRTDRKADLDALAASIAAHGLLQNLCVVETGVGRYEVDAGGRRLAALKQLAKDKVIAKDHPVPCQVIELVFGREVSLIEKIQRVAMDAMDEVEAFAALVHEGLSRESVAQRFGVTLRHVDQRLALSGLSPKLKAAWKRSEITLEAARAFCLVDDHATQEAVFKSLRRPVTSASHVRARLMDGRLAVTEPLVQFVGLSTYEDAGGRVVRDLFEEDAGFIEDQGLLAKLADDRLEVIRAEWLADGWSWVDVEGRAGSGEGFSSTRIYPDWRDPTETEQAELDRLEAVMDDLDAALEADSVEDDPRWSQRDSLEAEFETIRQGMREWRCDLMALSGVLLRIDRDGRVSATEGLVRSSEQRQVQAILRAEAFSQDGDARAEDGQWDGPEPAGSLQLPRQVARDLTLARTRAIRIALATDVDIALAVSFAALAQRAFGRGDMTGVALSAQIRTLETSGELEDRRGAFEAELPEGDLACLEWALSLSRERLLALLGVLTASAIDLSHEGATAQDARAQAIADVLARHLDVDMRKVWTADADYWRRLPKAALIEAICGGDEETGDARARADLEKQLGKLRKDDLAQRAAALHETSGYLPLLLVTPVGHGQLEVTSAGLEVLETHPVAAE